MIDTAAAERRHLYDVSPLWGCAVLVMVEPMADAMGAGAVRRYARLWRAIKEIINVSAGTPEACVPTHAGMPDPAKEIIKAAKSGDAERVSALLANDKSLVKARDKDGSTPLHCAVWKGHQQVVALLLKAGADVNAQNENDHWGTTPLHAAAHANQAAIAQLLIDYGADVQATDREGRTPMFHTTFHKARAVVKVLEKYNARA